MTAATSTEPLVRRDDKDGTATLTLNRPKARNALSWAMMAAIQDHLHDIREDRSVKVVVLAAEGPAFCAGHDLKEMRANPDQEFYKETFRQCSEMMLSITRLPQPVIARVHAMATAAGCQLVATCDLAVASLEAKFATPGVNIGLFCSTPMVALSRAVGRKKAMEMLLTGRPIGAEEAELAGLVNRAVPAEQLDEAVGELACNIGTKSPLTLAIGKEAFYRQVDLGLAEAYAYTAEVMTKNMMARDAAEGIDAFLEKRTPQWSGC